MGFFRAFTPAQVLEKYSSSIESIEVKGCGNPYVKEFRSYDAFLNWLGFPQQLDLLVGLATAETILAAHPQSVRTFFRLGATRVSGCNLFALRNAKALALLRLWQDIEKNRKKPWRIVSAFGPMAIVRFLTGTLTLDGAFALVSRKLGLTVAPVLMPFAEAAIDVDKPADKELAEAILAARG